MAEQEASEYEMVRVQRKEGGSIDTVSRDYFEAHLKHNGIVIVDGNATESPVEALKVAPAASTTDKKGDA